MFLFLVFNKFNVYELCNNDIIFVNVFLVESFWFEKYLINWMIIFVFVFEMNDIFCKYLFFNFL